MNIITEKSINKNVFPLNKNGPREKFKKGECIFRAEEGSEWDHNCYKLIDFLSTKLMEEILIEHGIWEIEDSFVQDDFFLLDCYKGDEETMNKIRDSDVYNKVITVHGYELSDSPQFKKWESKRIKSIIEKVSKCKLKCKHNFLTKTKSEKYILKTSYINTLNWNTPSWSLFDYEVDNGTKGKDGKFYNLKYKFKFGPQFDGQFHSVFFLHNIYTKAYDVLPENFYSLTPITSNFYRLYLLGLYSKNKKKDINVHIDFIEAARLLGLTTISESPLKQTIKRILNELKSKEFIKGFKNKKSVFIISK
jgi:hypothetical protein